jgi:hypothetical protein
MRKKQRLKGKPRRVTDDQIRVLQAWVPFAVLARAAGVSVRYGQEIRRGRVQHKNPSP